MEMLHNYQRILAACFPDEKLFNGDVLNTNKENIINLTANDLSGGHHPGEIAGKKRKGMDTGIICKLIKTCPPDGESTEGITQSFSGVTWIHTGPYI